ncbi:ATP-binding protein [Thalassotalea psychrophila]|uniref:histidine kinase n=1 Tax=Thalassotalea psychrophila TaxID=3065647 RepID=A0ABY9TY25_9GAMM|nr:ATP-binding protein [Colwelliaceae bacterium SQ149]
MNSKSLLSSLLFLFIVMVIKPAQADIADFNIFIENVKKIEDKKQANLKLQNALSTLTASSKQSISLYTEIAFNHFSLGDLNSSISTINIAKVVAVENNLPQAIADADKLVGVFNYYKGDFPKALSAYQQSLEFYLGTDELIKQAHLYNNIGLVQNSTGDTRGALKSYRLAEAIYQEHGSRVDKIDIRFNISGLFIALRRFDKAIEILPQIIKERSELDDQAGLALAYSDLGVVYKGAGKFELAEQNTLKALAYYERQNEGYHIATQHNNLADLYNRTGRIDKAIKFGKSCVQLSEKFGHQKSLGNCYYELSRGYFYKGDYQQSLAFNDLSNYIAVSVQQKVLMNDNLAMYALIHAAKNKPREAINTYQQFQNEKDKDANQALNEELAIFESKQLAQQVKQLQQAKELHLLQSSQNELTRNFIIVAFLLMLGIVFFFYRRKKELSTKKLLATQVKERTFELEQTTKQLKLANKIKSQFLANMSHEIRTPLTAVLGQSDAIINGEVEPVDLSQEIKIIQSNSLHLLQIVNDILDISKIEAEKLELDINAHDISELCNGLTNMFTEQAKKKQLKFKVTNNLPMPCAVNVDYLRLNQILINLCSNAIKFTQQGDILVDISLANNSLIFTVSDTGIGMNKQQLTKVFDSFVQGDNSINRRFGGTGLGLFLSGQLASMMKGEISVQSAYKKGSTFTFTLPYSPADIAFVKQKQQPIETNTKLKGKILLAEDHADNLKLITRLLSHLGLDVITAENGLQAIEQYFIHQPELILLDIQMPEMDGIEALNKLRQQGCEVPILALTANAMAHEIREYLQQGFDGHLKKPIERDVFISTVSHYFNSDINAQEFENTFNDVDISDLVTAFKADLSKDKTSLIKYHQEHDFKQFLHLVHRLAGAAAMFGFQKVSDIAVELETQLIAEDSEKIDSLLKRIIFEIEQVD